jgi:hypothetical protein
MWIRAWPETTRIGCASDDDSFLGKSANRVESKQESTSVPAENNHISCRH